MLLSHPPLKKKEIHKYDMKVNLNPEENEEHMLSSTPQCAVDLASNLI